VRDDVERRLVAAYRVHTVPDARTKDALLERLHETTDGVAPPSWQRIGVAAGLALAIAAAVLLLVRGAVLIVSPPDDSPAQAIYGADVPPAPTRAEPVPPRPTAAAPPAAATPAPSTSEAPRPRSPAHPVEPPGSTGIPGIGEEARLLARAQLALRDGDTATAATALAEHERRFPTGTMGLERDALRAIVRCTIERDAAAIAGARILVEDPRARSYATRIRDACGI
jgi:hypothetical protein